MPALPYRSKEILSSLFTHSWWQPLYLQITTVHLKYCPIFNMLANNNNKTDYCIIFEKRKKRTTRNGYCFEWEMLQWSSANLFNTIFKHQDAWVMTDFLVDWTRNPCIFFLVLFPTNVKSPVQDDIPREVKFVNVLYYWKCCTDIPSHFLLCWLICNNIDNKSWGLLGRPHF